MKSCHKVGFGFDSHVFSKKGTLVFGGVKFPKLPALKGHSDGDALFHAIIDSLLGAAGLGDIGDFYPDTSKKIKGISSSVMLKEALTRVKSKKLKPIHVDVTVVADRPRLSKVKSKLKKSISKAVKIPARSINIKGKTPEGIKVVKANNGVAVWSVATLAQN